MTGAIDTGVGIVLSSTPWDWRIALRIQSVFDTRPKQYLATLLINYSKTDRLRQITEIGIDYECDVATEAMTSCDSVAETPPPDVVRQSFGDSAVVLELRYWIDRPTVQLKMSAQNEVIEAVKDAFEEEGIKIPYPQRELLGREETDGLRVVAERDGPARGEAKRATRRTPPWESTTTNVEEPVENEYAGDLEDENEMAGETEDEPKAESKDKPTEAEE